MSLRNQSPDPTLKQDSTKTVLVPGVNLLTPVTIGALVDGRERLAVVP
jgi:hypothetical protein